MNPTCYRSTDNFGFFKQISCMNSTVDSHTILALKISLIWDFINHSNAVSVNTILFLFFITYKYVCYWERETIYECVKYVGFINLYTTSVASVPIAETFAHSSHVEKTLIVFEMYKSNCFMNKKIRREDSILLNVDFDMILICSTLFLHSSIVNYLLGVGRVIKKSCYSMWLCLFDSNYLEEFKWQFLNLHGFLSLSTYSLTINNESKK